MPAWKGWDEKQVLPNSTMAGFTAINAPMPQRQQQKNAANAEQQSSAQHEASAQPNSIAADYLGRGEDQQATPAIAQALHGPGTKKASGRGKKRASTASAPPKAKRRKSSSVSDGMTIRKASVRVDDSAKLASKASTAIRAKSKRKKAATDGEQHTFGESGMIRPVQVYAQATSMDSGQLTPQTTSLDAVKAAPGHGYTLYNGSHNNSSSPSIVEFAQPWLNAAASADQLAAGSNTLRRPPSVAPPPTVSHVEEEDVSLPSSIPSQASHSKSKSKQQLPTPIQSDAPSSSVRKRPTRKVKNAPDPITPDDDLLGSDDSGDEALVDLADAVEDTVARREPTPPPRPAKQNIRAVDANEDYGGALFSQNELELLNELRTSNQDPINKPIVRKTFPLPVLDRSPIFGATNGTVLRTCFRVGEALNVGCRAVRANKNVLLELYARVTSSWREPKPGRKQHFVFKDLYHDNPPHVNGTFELWDQSKLWELDSKVFLVLREEGIMCRVIARMRSEGTKWRLEILSVWETSWQDVESVAGIYGKDSEASLLAVGY